MKAMENLLSITRTKQEATFALLCARLMDSSPIYGNDIELQKTASERLDQIRCLLEIFRRKSD